MCPIYSFHVNIAIQDSKRDNVDSLIEVRWSCFEFPERKCHSLCQLLYLQKKVIPHDWLPVFVLTKNNLHFRVSFDGIGAQFEGLWAYSETFRKKLGQMKVCCC